MTTMPKTDTGQHTVADIMQRRVAIVPADMRLSDAARLLWDEQVSGAAVVTADGRPIGIVSASDLVRVRGYGPRYYPPGGAKAGAVDRDLAYSRCGQAGVHRALVLDQGRLLGIVTAFDIVEEVARGAEPVAPDELPFLAARVPEC
jgi:CBS domain-containing protein